MLECSLQGALAGWNFEIQLQRLLVELQVHRLHLREGRLNAPDVSAYEACEVHLLQDYNRKAVQGRLQKSTKQVF
jgi:hypothetical protein